MGGIQIRIERSFSQAVGEVLRFVKDPLGTFAYLQRTWGDVVPLPLPGPKTIQFTHPEQVGEVLRLPVKDETSRSMEDIMGQSLLTGDGADASVTTGSTDASVRESQATVRGMPSTSTAT